MALPMSEKKTTVSSFCEANSQIPEWLRSEHLTGTTIMAVEFDGGVVVGADSRTTTWSYVANRVTHKLTKISDGIYCCRSGYAADTQAISYIISCLQKFYRLYTRNFNEPPTVHTVANHFRNCCSVYREQLPAGIIVAGWDKEKGGQVYSVPLGGVFLRTPCAFRGSGSIHISGCVDAYYKAGMKKEECLNFVAKAVSLAMFRDKSMGGIFHLAVITGDGVERKTYELPRFYEG